MSPNYNITQEELETIERYINKTMTLEKSSVFEENLKNNPDFKTKFDDIKTVLLGIETQALKEKMEEFHANIPKTKISVKQLSKVRSFNFTKLVAAAVVIIAVGSYWFYNGDSDSNLFHKYFTPDPGLPTTMSKSSNYSFYDAMVNYKQGDYNTAIDKWDELQLKSPKNDTLNYFLGVANLAEGHTDLAITYLQNTTLQTESVFIKDAHYYLGLAFLKNNNKKEAITSLQFSNTDNSKQILSKLEN